jgi:hypothetical protein
MPRTRFLSRSGSRALSLAIALVVSFLRASTISGSRAASPEYLEPLVATLDRPEACPGRCRKPVPRSASQKVSNHSVELLRALTRRPMATAPQNAQLRIRKSFVRSSRPLYGHHAVAITVNQQGWHNYLAQALREIGFQPAPPNLVLAKRAERPT